MNESDYSRKAIPSYYFSVYGAVVCSSFSGATIMFPLSIMLLYCLQFPPRFAAGDVGSSELDLKLPNSVFNTLKQHSYREERQSARLHEKKEHATHVRETILK